MAESCDVLTMLDRYAERQPQETEVLARICALVTSRPDALLRSAFDPGHITASAWIVDPRGELCLLTKHRKLGRWLQLGGHVDGDDDPARAALREAREESGLTKFELVRWRGRIVPFDLDVHRIPARGAEPEHEHHDLRFLLVADPEEPLVISDESQDLRWIEVARLSEYSDEESVLRLARKHAAGA